MCFSIRGRRPSSSRQLPIVCSPGKEARSRGFSIWCTTSMGPGVVLVAGVLDHAGDQETLSKGGGPESRKVRDGRALADRDRQARALKFGRVPDLLVGQADARHLASQVRSLRVVLRQSALSRWPDLERAVPPAGPARELVADQLGPMQLGALEVGRSRRRSSLGVLVPRPEEGRAHPVVDVVVLLGATARAAAQLRLEVRQPGLQRLSGRHQRSSGRAVHSAGRPGEHAAEQLVERRAVPVCRSTWRLADAQASHAAPTAVQPVAGVAGRISHGRVAAER